MSKIKQKNTCIKTHGRSVLINELKNNTELLNMIIKVLNYGTF